MGEYHTYDVSNASVLILCIHGHRRKEHEIDGSLNPNRYTYPTLPNSWRILLTI